MAAQQRSLNMRNELEACHVQRFALDVELEAAKKRIVELEAELERRGDEEKYHDD